MTEPHVSPLRSLARWLRQGQAGLTEAWMQAVAADAGLARADRLGWELPDHLPDILDEICRALEAQDLGPVEPTIERDARQHGKLRWRQGYRIDELVRELEVFRQVLAGAVTDFAESHSFFTRHQETRARHLIDEAFSLVTVASIREVVAGRDRRIDEYVGHIEHANHELTQKQQLISDLYESRMQITRSVAHDLRNFLNAFTISLQLIARAPSKADAGLALATRQAADMKQLLDEMAEYSVVLGDCSPVKVEEVDLGELFDELIAAAQPGIEAKGLRLTTFLDPALKPVFSNRLKLKQVALNLLSNATKYTMTGGIDLSMAPCGDSRWYLRVADSGIGIASPDRERVFDEFERAAGDEIPGTGLGLAIVRELCRTLDGEILFESREGRGTIFEIRFPVELPQTR
jgi:signal transduction histidine kinase